MKIVCVNPPKFVKSILRFFHNIGKKKDENEAQ